MKQRKKRKGLSDRFGPEPPPKQVEPAELKYGVPDLASPHLASLCAQLVNGASPLWLDPPSLSDSDKRNDCVFNVARRIKEHGGSAVNGWALWETQGVIIEGECHVVWRDPSGQLIDVSPMRPDVAPPRLFLPDESMVWDGSMQIDNVRMATVDDPRVHEYIKAHEARFKMMNAGRRKKAFEVRIPTWESDRVNQELYRTTNRVLGMLEGDPL